jgi:hypothetical protein
LTVRLRDEAVPEGLEATPRLARRML